MIIQGYYNNDNSATILGSGAQSGSVCVFPNYVLASVDG